MRITFTKTVQYETKGRNDGPIFEAGTTHELRDDIAERWLRRDVAVVEGEAVPKQPKAAANDADGRAPKRLPGAGAVVIPDGYRDLKAAELQALVGQLSTATPRTKEDVFAVIEAELALRNKPAH